MALKTHASFSGGELDPALRERTTLQKYDSGAATARNVVVTKTGRLISRGGRKWFNECKTANKKVKLHAMSHSYKYIEWGDLYARVYSFDGTLIGDYVHTYVEADLDLLQFTDVDFDNVLIFKEGSIPLRLDCSSGGGFVTGTFDPINLPSPTFTVSPATGTGYAVQYAWTAVIAGEETLYRTSIGTTENLPISTSEANSLNMVYTVSSLPTGKVVADLQEFRVYRRPTDAGSFGFIGSVTKVVDAGTTITATFEDVGQAADYTHQPPALNVTINNNLIASPEDLDSKTGVMYQQRLQLSYRNQLESSRVGFPYNFFRDFPLDAASSLSYEAAGEGYARVLRLIESNGLIVFTSSGIHRHTGPMSPLNLGLEKKGGWVIDELIKPISIPGGVLFIDAATNSVRQLTFSDENGTFLTEELSIFSDHLFATNRVRSWAFQSGRLPLLWVTFTDGTYSSFTYEPEHKMRAWTRHDSGYDIEYVASVGPGVDGAIEASSTSSAIIFVTNKGGVRSVELGVDRFIPVSVLAADPEADKKEHIAAMDAFVEWFHLINDDLTDDDMTLTPVVADTWDGALTLSVVDDAIFPDPGIGAVGTFFKHFHPVDRTETLLEVTARASDNSITVMPQSEFPSDYAVNARLYEAKTTFTGLDHLDGENAAVVADGYVISSPNNNITNTADHIVAAGSLTLAAVYCIVHIGRPFVSDIETLDIATVEQRPVFIESKTVNKLYVKMFNSRGISASSRFPINDKLMGMDSSNIQSVDMGQADSYDVDYTEETPIVGNRYDQPKTRRIELTLPGDWKSQGRVCLRNVDPVHFEILSIIPDMDDLGR